MVEFDILLNIEQKTQQTSKSKNNDWLNKQTIAQIEWTSYYIYTRKANNHRKVRYQLRLHISTTMLIAEKTKYITDNENRTTINDQRTESAAMLFHDKSNGAAAAIFNRVHLAWHRRPYWTIKKPFDHCRHLFYTKLPKHSTAILKTRITPGIFSGLNLVSNAKLFKYKKEKNTKIINQGTLLNLGINNANSSQDVWNVYDWIIYF